MPQASAVARRLVGPGIFLAAAVFITWPWAIHPGSTTSAFLGGDVTISIQKFRLLVDEGLSPFQKGHLDSISWPRGIDLSPTIDTVSFLNTLWLWLGSLVIGPIATHGLMAVLGMVLTAVVAAAFVTEATGSKLAGFVAGTAYGFSAHMIVIAWAASTYTWMFLLVLPMWAIFRLARDPTPRRALLAGAAYLPALYWTPYFALHAAAVGAACLVVFLLVRAHEHSTLRRRAVLALLVVGPWIAGLFVYLMIGIANDFAGVPDRSEQEHYEQSAHPLMYVVPGTDSILWGDGPNEWLARKVPRAAGVQLYVGISVVVLGLVGAVTSIVPWLRERSRPAPPAALAGLMGVAVVVVCGLSSLPPRVWNHRLPTPSALILAVEPGLRAGQRFVMPLLAGTAVLAGLGALYLLRRFGANRNAAIGVTAAIALVVFADTHMRPFDDWERTPPESPAMAALANAPEGPVLHWHYSGFLPVPAPRACYLQEQHSQVLVNDCALTLDRNPPLVKWDQMPACLALQEMRAFGVRYVIVDVQRPDVIKCFGEGEEDPYRVVGSDPDMSVYEFVKN